MKNKKFKLTFLGAALCFALIGCSNDDSTVDSNNNSESGIISNGEVTLTYGEDLLKHYGDYNGDLINFERLNKVSARSANVPDNYNSFLSEQGIDLSTAQDLTANPNSTFDAPGIYRIPQSVTVSSSFNVNGSGKIFIIDGNLNGNVNFGDNTVIVSSTGVINNNSNFSSTGKLYNWGEVNLSNSNFNGEIKNNNLITFDNDVTLNGTSKVTNKCKVIFKGKLTLDSEIKNYSFVHFENGFMINGSGILNLFPGSYAKLTSGDFKYDGVIKNEDSDHFARLDLLGTLQGNINGSNRIIGKIDVNFPASSQVTLASLQNDYKANSQVTLNQNLNLTNSYCMPFSTTCDVASLGFTNLVNYNYILADNSFLSATDVKVNGEYAYVSYHSNDEVYNGVQDQKFRGAIRVFKFNQGSLQALAQAEFSNIEFNGIDVNNDILYAVGGSKAGGRLLKTNLISNSFNTSDLSVFETYKLPSSTAKNTYFYDNFLYLVSGNNNGGLFKADPTKDFAVSVETNKDGAKYVANNGVKQAFFAVETSGAYLRIANIDGTGAVEYQYTNLVQDIQNGKNVITMDNDFVYVALSDRGVAKFALANGEMVGHFEPNEYRENNIKVFRKNGATNGVAVEGCYVYLANGADGIIVLNKDTFNPIGSFKIGSGSANFVSVSNGYLFVATGRNGLNVIKINN